MKTLSPIWSQQVRAGVARVECVALNLTLGPALPLGAAQEIVLFVDELTIAGTVTLQGRNLSVFARKITAAPGATIDVSGAAATPVYPRTAADGAFPGARGHDGQPGNRGGDAGRVILLAGEMAGRLAINARGGQGGLGQNGGDGIKGGTPSAVGPRNKDEKQNQDGENEGPEGDRGFMGGDAGEAGRSGDGGAGGMVWVLTREGSPRADVVVANEGGEPGPSGSHGDPGQGGDGGAGGLGVYCYTQMHHGGGPEGETWETFECRQSTSRGPDGPRGFAGQLPREQSARGAKGGPGAADVSATALVGDFETVAPASYANLVLRKAQIDYLNQELSKAAALLAWLDELGAASKPAAPAGSRPYRLVQAFGTDQSELLDGVGARARAYRLQLTGGLDFFGKAYSYVPLNRVEFYAGRRDWLLSQLEFFEAQAQEVEKRDVEVRRLVELSQAAREKVAAQLAAAGLDQAQANDLAARSQARVRDLISEIESEKAQLRLANDAFVAAVGRLRNDCSFDAVMKIAEATYAIVNAMYGNYTQAIAGGAALLDSVKSGIDTLDKLQDALKRIRQVEGNIDGIVDGYHTLQKLHGDSTKEQQNILLASKADIDAATAPYLQLAEASQLRATAQRLIDLSQAKNEAWLSYVSALAQLADLEATKRDRQGEIDQLSNKIARAQQLEYPSALKDFLIKARHEATMYAVRNLYSLHRALSYWSLQDTAIQPVRVEDFELSAIRAAYGSLEAQLTAFTENLGSDDSPYGDLSIVISAAKHPHLIAALKRNDGGVYRLSFLVRLSTRAADIVKNADFVTTKAFAATRGLLVNKFKVMLKGAVEGSDEPEIAGTLRHSGQVELVDRNDVVHTFSHVPSRVGFRYYPTRQDGEPVAFASEKGSIFSHRSPYTLWSIEIPESDNIDMNLSGLTEVRITFSEVTLRSGG